jgi:hypothetical protein
VIPPTEMTWADEPAGNAAAAGWPLACASWRGYAPQPASIVTSAIVPAATAARHPCPIERSRVVRMKRNLGKALVNVKYGKILL